MKKTELIDRIAKTTDLTKKQAAQAFDACMSSMIEALCAGECVQISGFGTFSVKEKPAHPARNPRTNETVMVDASRHVTFISGKTLKEKINK